MSVPHITIDVNKFKSFEKAVRRFRKRVERTGLMKEYLASLTYEKPSERRQRKKRERKRLKKFQELKAQGGRRAR